MKRLSYAVLPPRGAEERVREGTVLDLLRSIPYLLGCRITPPLHVVNELLATGESEMGMSGGCRWSPFALTPDEFGELVAALAAGDAGGSAAYVEPPAWVQTLEEWRCWTLEYCHGIPAARNLEYSHRLRELEAARHTAEVEGDYERLARLASVLTALAVEYSDWLVRHRRPHRWERT